MIFLIMYYLSHRFDNFEIFPQYLYQFHRYLFPRTTSRSRETGEVSSSQRVYTISLELADDLELHSVDIEQVFTQADKLNEGANGRYFITQPPDNPDVDSFL